MLIDRHAQILDLAKRQGRVEVDDLAARFAVSVQTVRKDLNELCNRGALQRVHGGAVYPSTIENMQ